ncbi:hypothetical protein BKA56DRAFT_660819 [Ilyonectria sp. MPI-CAGE-AT-0026]|nr:hypothetical protein BKA56DRAFT_660819 [Ilyonectria sp. MPI-CAGE-AT-0026]
MHSLNRRVFVYSIAIRTQEDFWLYFRPELDTPTTGKFHSLPHLVRLLLDWGSLTFVGDDLFPGTKIRVKNNPMLAVNLHLTDDEVGVFAEGFRKPCASADDEIDARINKDANIHGTCSLLEIPAHRKFTIIFPGGQVEMNHMNNAAPPPRWFGYGYHNSQTEWDPIFSARSSGILTWRWLRTPDCPRHDSFGCLLQDIREITAKDFKCALVPTKPMQGDTRFLSECYACVTIPTTFNLSLDPGLFTLITAYNKNKSCAHGGDIPRYPGVECHTVDSFRAREAHIIVIVLSVNAETGPRFTGGAQRLNVVAS